MIPTTRSFAAPLEVLQREFDRAFTRAGDMFENGFSPTAFAVDIHETADSIIVEAELPGFEKDQVDISLENRVLTVSAAREEVKNEGEQHLKERRNTRMSRSFRLPATVNEDSVEATLNNGVLTLTIQKRDEVKPRKIEVK